MQKEKKKCKTCYGYGLWAFGDKVPMGPMDAGDGMPTIKCPECGASYNDVSMMTKPKKKAKKK